MCSHRVWSGISLNPRRTLPDPDDGPDLLRLSLSGNYLKSIFHLLLIYNHAVADGISAVILTNQILENYSKLQKNETLEMTCTRVKTIAELKSDEMPNGDVNIQKLTDYANKVSFFNVFNNNRTVRTSNPFLGKWRIRRLLGRLYFWFKRKRKFYHQTRIRGEPSKTQSHRIEVQPFTVKFLRPFLWLLVIRS